MKQFIHVGCVYVYGDCMASFSTASIHCDKAVPDVNNRCVVNICDLDGGRTEMEKMLASVKKGDHVVVASIFTFEDPDNETAMIHRLHKLQRKGAIVHTILEPAFSLEQYDEMLKTWHISQKQRKEYLTCCGKTPYEPKA